MSGHRDPGRASPVAAGALIRLCSSPPVRVPLPRRRMGWDNVITHMPYGDRFRKHRRWMHDHFQTKTALEGYRPIQRRETYTLLSGLLESPAAFLSHINR